ncbi:hypothetical protein QNO00_02375 [Arthrobacter sp. zg-Y1219]|uniref:hypothetical protein n=1 Tax=Arthrobacter sp. zg-Y1219 TaxID=3049067 RepID=UPI0024C2ED95|nr:hypothetical protein [Arthrobacter sp. zg-Y1219]MDK1359119.1 hypothetical protein [Arthrobacter sp. zg-Y1219]
MPATLFPYPGVLPAVTSTGGALFSAGGDFSSVELQAMEKDGLLKRVYADTYVRWDLEPDPVCRAVAAANCLSERLRARIMLGRLTAAWVYGCAPAPQRLQLLIDHGRRTTALAPFSIAVLHEVRLGPEDGMDIAGIMVTTPLRTAMDLARHGPRDQSVSALLAIAADPVLRCPLGRVRSAVEAVARLPGKSTALHRLDAAIALAASGQVPEPRLAPPPDQTRR